MEVKIRNRSRLMQVLATALFMTLVWAYAQLEWGLPQAVKKTLLQSRGEIVSADGRVLARSVDDKRLYPQGKLAGQLLGMMGETAGLEGLEAAYDAELRAGQDLRLTIDTAAQAAAEGALARFVPAHAGEAGSVVVLETRTGRVLAAANYPAFDPNHWRASGPEVWRNRAFVDTFEPGSTVKGLVVAAALNEGLTTPNTLYQTPMKRFVGGRWGSTLNDAVDHPPTLTTQGILRYSSNVGMSHIVENFPHQKLRGYLTAYGFGEDVPMPAMPATSGQLQPLRQWNELVRATNAFGQGMSATTLQLAAAFNTLANDGLYVSPRLVEGVGAPVRREVVRSDVARRTRQMLQAVVEEGIPTQAGVKGYHALGKTGTAQVVIDGKYSKSQYNSVFTGAFPAEQPRVTIAVVVNGAKRNYHGSQLAAPIFREIYAELLSQWGSRPDQLASK